MISPARVAAYEALRGVTLDRQALPAALTRARRRLTDERDRALATELVTGTLRWQAELDRVIEAFARRSVTRLDPEVLQVLRLAAYQLLHLARVPAASAVNDAVELTRRAGKGSAAGLVNGVLRTISRQAHNLPLPQRPPLATGHLADPGTPAREAALEYLSTSLSHPRWLAGRWLDRLGFAAAEAWEHFNNEIPPLTLRVNRLKTDREPLVERLRSEGVTVEPARYAPDGLIVRSGNPLRTSLAGEGVFLIQDEASQLVALLAACKRGERVLDACASPGGKTTAMASLLEDQGLIVAADLRPARVRLLQETVARSGARSIRIVQADLRQALPFDASFDLVFVDAPCSGLGTLRRDPDIRWSRHEHDLTRFAASERQMLHNAAAAVGPGGRLVYSTCSSEPEENDDVVASFLDAHHAFRRLDLRGQHDWTALFPVLDDQGFLRTSPMDHRLEAFFGAVMVRER